MQLHRILGLQQFNHTIGKCLWYRNGRVPDGEVVDILHSNFSALFIRIVKELADNGTFSCHILVEFVNHDIFPFFDDIDLSVKTHFEFVYLPVSVSVNIDMFGT